MLLTWRAPIFDNMSLSVKLNVVKRVELTLRQLPTTTDDYHYRILNDPKSIW